MTTPAGAVPAVHTVQFEAGGNASGIIWSRHVVSVPTLLVPYNAAGLTTQSDFLGSIRIVFARERPSTLEQGIPPGFNAISAGLAGSCYLWAAGVWFIGIHCTRAAAGEIIPFYAIPDVEGSIRTYLYFSRGSTHAVTTRVNVGLSAVRLLTAQQLIACQAVQVQTFGTIRFRWETTPTTQVYQQMVDGDLRTFEGATLPLSDLYASAPSGTVAVRLIRYV